MGETEPFDRETFLLKTWPEALESGEFRQTTGQLFDPKTGSQAWGASGISRTDNDTCDPRESVVQIPRPPSELLRDGSMH